MPILELQPRRASLVDSSRTSWSQALMKETSSLGYYENSSQFSCPLASFESSDTKGTRRKAYTKSWPREPMDWPRCHD